MKKRILALLCAAVLLLAAVPAASALEGEQARAADTLYTLGLVRGTASGGFALEDGATRAQAAALLVRLAGCEAEAEADLWISGFRDVPVWAETAVTYASHRGWTSGTDGYHFKPDQAVTANAWCTFLLRMLGYSDKAGDFTVSDAAVFAQHIGLVSQSWSGTLTRGDLFEIAREALTFRYKDSSETVIQRLAAKGVVSQSAVRALGLADATLTARQLADRCTAAVFQLDAYEEQSEIDAKDPSSNASGFFISADGLAVTNYHSIADNIYATATLSTGEQYEITRVLFYSVSIDIAVVRVSMTSLAGKKASAFAHLDMAGTGDIRAGDVVYTLGSPLGLGLAVSSGIISDTARQVKNYDLPCIMDTADISMGSSGGALLNVYGQVIGVTSGAFSYGNNMYLAVPIDPVLKADLTCAGETLAQVAAAQAAAAQAAAAQAKGS